jgi:predicted XRE-type DNA-binding protein
MNSDTTHGKILKFADQMLKFPKKERFNQDLAESVREIKERTSKPLAKDQLSTFDVRSQK